MSICLPLSGVEQKQQHVHANKHKIEVTNLSDNASLEESWNHILHTSRSHVTDNTDSTTIATGMNFRPVNKRCNVQLVSGVTVMASSHRRHRQDKTFSDKNFEIEHV